MDAIAELSAEKGYGATKIADIVSRAGVARKTLYDNFDGKEEVFLAAIDTVIKEAMARVAAACADVGVDWKQQVEAGLKAMLSYVAEHPAAARMCMVEALSATPAASARYDEAMRECIGFLRQIVPKNTGLPETIEETLVGGVAWILHQQIRRGEAEKALDLLPELSDFVLSPYHGVGKSGPTRADESDSTVTDSKV